MTIRAGVAAVTESPLISPRLAGFLDGDPLPTPFLAIDETVVSTRLAALRRAFPGADVLYAVKANPLPGILSRVAAGGAGGDVASGAEVRQCLAAGFAPDRLSFGNTIKRPDDIAFAHAAGITRFTIDSLSELQKVARHAPGSSVSVRLLVETTGAQWPLSRKFGCDAEMALALLRTAPALGLHAAGLTFHVGSQQTDPHQWDGPIAACAAIDARLRAHGQPLESLNLGGGFPARYSSPVPPVEAYAHAIERSLQRHFGHHPPRIIIEPGRSLVAEAGVLVTSVLLVARKSAHDVCPWAFIDCGKFGGLAETADEAIRYPIVTPRRVSHVGAGGAGGAGGGEIVGHVPTILAGPTCDSADILYERTPCLLPVDLREGDRLHILSAGAYTFTYASVGFNGISPLHTVVV